MQVTSTPSTPNAAPPTPGMAAGHADDGAFANLLSGHTAGAAASPQGAEAASAAARRAQAKQSSEPGDAKRPEKTAKDKAPSTEAGDTAQAAEATDEPDDAEAAAADPPALDPALLEWLAALNRPAAAPGAQARSAGDAAATGEAGPATQRLLWRDAPALGGARADGPAADARTGAQTLDIAALLRDAAAGTSATEGAPLAALQLDATSAPADSARTPDGLAALTAVTPTAGERGTAAAPVAVTVRTPATAPEFREALAAQVSVLARDGVQQARLHLNPAEMGPISVQIALHGTQAQVNFGADSAATRDILQAGLPELAAALSQAGLTLAGGGVSQHAHGDANGHAPHGQAGERAGGDAEAVDPVAAAQHERSSLRAALGGVDLFA